MSSDAQNVECPQCGRAVSTYVKTCPKCGYKLFRKRKWHGLGSRKQSLRDSQRNVIDRAKARELAEDERSAVKQPPRKQAPAEWPETSYREPDPQSKQESSPSSTSHRPPRGGDAVAPPNEEKSAPLPEPSSAVESPEDEISHTQEIEPESADEPIAGRTPGDDLPDSSDMLDAASSSTIESEEPTDGPSDPNEPVTPVGEEISAATSADPSAGNVYESHDDSDGESRSEQQVFVSDGDEAYDDDPYSDEYDAYDDEPAPPRRNQNGILMLFILVIMGLVGGVKYLLSVWGG